MWFHFTFFFLSLEWVGGALAPQERVRDTVQENLAHKKHPPPRTLQQDYLGTYGGPRGVRFRMSEVPP